MTTLRVENTEAIKQVQALNESINELKNTSEADKKQLTSKLTKAEKIAESYKRIANETVRRYIDSKATMLGVSSNEIKNKLGESYTLDDIDKICEELKSYALNISKLPFNIERKVKMKVTESKNDLLVPSTGMDDEIDDSLLTLANLK